MTSCCRHLKSLSKRLVDCYVDISDLFIDVEYAMFILYVGGQAFFSGLIQVGEGPCLERGLRECCPQED